MIGTVLQEEKVNAENIPVAMRETGRWLVWAYRDRKGKRTKEPFCAWHNDAEVPHGRSTDPTTWTTFDEALAFWEQNQGRFDGIGFVLGGGWCGVDLDDCRDPATGLIEDWAHSDIDDLDSYAEVSPSGTGVKVFIRTNFTGPGLGPEPDIDHYELYPGERYFTVTGNRVELTPETVNEGTEAFTALYQRVAEGRKARKKTSSAPPVLACDSQVLPSRDIRVRMARDWLACQPGAQQGRKADGYCFRIAIKLVNGHALNEDEGTELLYEWGQRPDQTDKDGQPYPWTLDEVRHKVQDALEAKYDGVRGDLLANWYRYADESVGHIVTGGNLASMPLGVEKSLACNGDTLSKSEPVLSEEAKYQEWHQRLQTQGYRFEPISSVEFAAKRYKTEWLVKRLLVRDQPCIMGGAKKVLKTSLLVDLGISLGSGLPFLDHFTVHQPMRTALISGESGDAVLQATAFRVCAAKGIKLADVDLFWDFRLPQLSRAGELLELSKGLEKLKIEVAVIDPLYLCLLAGQQESRNAGNIFDMGPLLNQVSHACLDAGATPILATHARKNVQGVDPIDLEDLAWAGLAEFARQWLLVSRRQRYVPGSGTHLLWLSAGGSAGHSGLWALDVDEGVIEDDFTGRVWKVEVLTSGEAKVRDNERKTVEKEGDETALDTEFLIALDGWESPHGDPPTKTGHKKQLRWRTDKYERVFNRLVQKKVIELYQAEIKSGYGKKKADVMRRVVHGDTEVRHGDTG